jgi:hypothetical protein
MKRGRWMSVKHWKKLGYVFLWVEFSFKYLSYINNVILHDFFKSSSWIFSITFISYHWSFLLSLNSVKISRIDLENIEMKFLNLFFFWRIYFFGSFEMKLDIHFSFRNECINTQHFFMSMLECLMSQIY